MERHDVVRLLVRAEKARRAAMQPYFTKIGITFGQGHARILNALLIKDNISQRELADVCHMDVTTMSRNLDKLEAQGYLKRERDPECRRAFLICLTEEGRGVAQKVHEFFREVDEQIWAGFGEQEMERFCADLKKICESLEGMEPKRD